MYQYVYIIHKIWERKKIQHKSGKTFFTIY